MAGYYDTLAVDYTSMGGFPQPTYETSSGFEVIEGRGLDAQVRQGIDGALLENIKVVVLSVIFVACLCFVRVGLLSVTLASLEAASDLRSEISAAQTFGDQLRIEESILSSESRIGKIATQNYGMVKAEETTTITIVDPEETLDEEAVSGESSVERSAEAMDAEGATVESSAEASVSDTANAESTSSADSSTYTTNTVAEAA